MRSSICGQFASSMLLRLIILLLLIIVVLQSATIFTQGNLIGLRRIFNKLNSSTISVNNCKNFKCTNRSSFQIDKSLLYTKLTDVGNDDHKGNNEISSEEGRGKKQKKKKDYGKIFIIFGGIAKATVLYFMIQAVAILASKALVIAKAALLIAIALALKKSTDHKTSYEIVKYPHYSHIQTHSSSVDYDHSSGNGSGGGYDIGSRKK